MDLEAYIEQYGDYLYRIAFIYMKDQQTAEEVVQDVFMKLYVPVMAEFTEEDEDPEKLA